MSSTTQSRTTILWTMAVLWSTALVAAVFAATAPADEPATVDFNRDIRPLLSDRCYQCHGPDEAKREAELRLDTKEGAFSELEAGGFAIVPGKIASSALYERIANDDEDLVMPPVDSEKSLSASEIELLKKWIEQGAPWREHWSFVAPERPPLPEVEHQPQVHNPIDAFVIARLEAEELAPSSAADKETLVRRVALDLTGLPPTIEEIDAYLADTSPDAYETLVDRLLASPRYGEHMARYWLDVVRYADTHGMHFDNERSIWLYRDWVISAFNQNMPFDQFTIEQLAGDLLPDASLDQQIASGFNRCHVTTNEGGSIDEEVYVRYIVDRVETTSTVWLGLTTGCAVCHDHKFDPISQKEFYQLFAFFNSTTDKTMDGNALAPPPVVKVPTAEHKEQLAKLARQTAEIQSRIDAAAPALDARLPEWHRKQRDRLGRQWQLLDPLSRVSTGGASLRELDDLSVLAEGENPDTDVYEVTAATDKTDIQAVRLEALTHESLPHGGPGRADSANFVLSEFELEVTSLVDPEQHETVQFTRALADHSQEDYPASAAIDGKSGNDEGGWAVDGSERRENRAAVFYPAEPFGFEGGSLLRVRLRFESEDDQHAIGRFRLALSDDPAVSPTVLGDWHKIGPFTAEDGAAAFTTDFGPEVKLDLSATYNDGKLAWKQDAELVDGKTYKLPGAKGSAVYFYRSIDVSTARRLDVKLGPTRAVRVWHNGSEVRLERNAEADREQITLDLQVGENHLLVKAVGYGDKYALTTDITDRNVGGVALGWHYLLSLSPDKISDDERTRLRDYHRIRQSPELRQLSKEMAAVARQEKKVDAQIPRTLVSQEREEPRPAYFLERGEYDKRKEEVTRKVPASLPPLPDDAPKNRLGFARWLVDPAHPFTARVTVNRFWQQYFGTGIVKTSEDFGSQGEAPSHPRLLDWLATEFIRSGWDVKHLQKLIVTSGTYRQSSRMTPELDRQDPENRLLARGPRFRMDAEVVRDHALAVSGLLVEKLGGKSVRPYQPPGLWKAVGYTSSNTANFKQDHGEALLRRSLYTFWKRTSPPPSMQALDAPSRETCTARRSRTNTPLAALVLLNDVQFVEAARHLAERMMTEGGTTVQMRIEFAFRLATGRRPESVETSVLHDLYQMHLQKYRDDKASADQLLHVGESKHNEQLDAGELAAWTIVAQLILNLNETITKG